MTKNLLIEQTLSVMERLPQDKAAEISDFAALILHQYERQEDVQLTKGIQTLISSSTSFDFLEEDQDLYSLSDLKEVYPHA